MKASLLTQRGFLRLGKVLYHVDFQAFTQSSVVG